MGAAADLGAQQGINGRPRPPPVPRTAHRAPRLRGARARRVLHVLHYCLARDRRLAWTFTFVSGAVVSCGVVGLLLSYVAVPPAIPGGSPPV